PANTTKRGTRWFAIEMFYFGRARLASAEAAGSRKGAKTQRIQETKQKKIAISPNCTSLRLCVSLTRRTPKSNLVFTSNVFAAIERHPHNGSDRVWEALRHETLALHRGSLRRRRR